MTHWWCFSYFSQKTCLTFHENCLQYFMINLHERMLPYDDRGSNQWPPNTSRTCIRLSHPGRLYTSCSGLFVQKHRLNKTHWLIVLGFNDTSTLEGHFVSSPREREKRDRRESRGDEREGQGRKRNRNESEETEEIKTFPLYPYPLQG